MVKPALDEAELLTALRAGDETAFATLVTHYHPALVRLALVYVNERGLAEEVAQETWLGVLRGLNKFEGRSSLKTWLFTILTNRAKTRAQRENRTVPFSDWVTQETEGDDPAVEATRFRSADDPVAPGHWAQKPQSWENIPEAHWLSEETAQVVQRALEALPTVQQEVMRLRDMEAWTADEVCNVLGITATNQRVLLHRARSKVRRALERYWSDAA